jgi:putative CocE/NonD family hydrolase
MAKHSFEGLHDVDIEEDVAQVLPDGTRLYADVYRPAAPGPHPVLLVRMPYDKRTVENMAYQHPCWYARRGYLVVVQDVRGRCRSEGDFYPFQHEEADGALAVEWAAALPGSNGRVGMYGFSYAGATQLLAACARPPSLKAIAPAMTASQFHDGWTYRGGALNLAFVLTWAAQLAAGQALRKGDDRAARALAAAEGAAGFAYLPLQEQPALLESGALAQFYFDWLAHPEADAYWRRWSLEHRYDQIAVPALHIGGWYDIFLTGTLRNFQATAARHPAAHQLLVGPWLHMPWSQRVGSVDFGPHARSQVDERQLAFFNRHLRGQGGGADPVSIFVMGENRWRSFDAWPPAGTTERRLFLRSGGSANSAAGDGRLRADGPQSEPPDVFVYAPLFPVRSAGGASCCFADLSPMGPADQGAVESTLVVLVYTSEPFAAPRLLVGAVTLKLWAVSSACDTDFTAKLCLVSRAGHSTNVCGGIIRARYREAPAAPSLIEPGKAYLYSIDLGSTAVRLEAGESLRVQVSSSDFPQWDRNLNTGGVPGAEPPSAAVVATQFVLHDAAHPSHLEFQELAT